MSGQLRASAAVRLGKESFVATEEEGGWAPEPILSQTDKMKLFPCWELFIWCPACSL